MFKTILDIRVKTRPIKFKMGRTISLSNTGKFCIFRGRLATQATVLAVCLQHVVKKKLMMIKKKKNKKKRLVQINVRLDYHSIGALYARALREPCFFELACKNLLLI